MNDSIIIAYFIQTKVTVNLATVFEFLLQFKNILNNLYIFNIFYIFLFYILYNNLVTSISREFMK